MRSGNVAVACELVFLYHKQGDEGETFKRFKKIKKRVITELRRNLPPDLDGWFQRLVGPEYRSLAGNRARNDSLLLFLPFKFGRILVD